MLRLLQALFLITFSAIHAVGAEVSVNELRAAAARAIPLLERSSAHSLGQRACFTCHHGGSTVLAFHEAWQRGLAVDEKNLKEQLVRNYQRLGEDVTRFTAGHFETGKADLIGQSLWVLDAVGKKPDAVTTASVGFLLEHDAEKDHWAPTDSRPPTVGSHFTTSYVALRGLLKFGGEEQAERIQGRRDAILLWLLSNPSADTEDSVSRLRLLHLVASEGASFQGEGQKILAAQREDGGWAQMESMNSDAYATATALAALVDTGIARVEDSGYQRGLRYLLDGQLKDGSWHVRKRTKSLQPYFESAFPHKEDQFISISATSWAVYALLKAVPIEEKKVVEKYLETRDLDLGTKKTQPGKVSVEAVGLFKERIQPVLRDKCFKCHSEAAEKLKAGLYLDSREKMLAGGENGPALVPGDPDASLLTKCLIEEDGMSLMPPKKGLTKSDIADFRRWIELGAPVE